MVKNKILVFFSRIYEVGASVFLVRIISELLSPADFSVMGVFLAISQGIVWFFLSPIQNYILVNSSRLLSEGEAFNHFNFEATVSLIIGLCAASLFWCFHQVGGIDFRSNTVIFLFLTSIISTILYQTYIPFLNIIGRSRLYSKICVVYSTMIMIVPPLLCYMYDRDYVSWLWGITGCQIIMIVYVFSLIKKIENKSKTDFYGIDFNKIVVFSLPLMVAVGLQWFISQGYRVSLTEFISENELGFFIMAFTFGGRFFNAFEKIFSTIWLPELYNNKINAKNAWLKYLKKMLLVYTILAIVLILFSDFLFNIMVSKEFDGAEKFIFAGILFDFFRCSLSAASQYNLVTNTNQIQLYSNFIVSIFMLLSIYYFKSNLSCMQFAFPVSIAIAFFFVIFRNYFIKNENC